MKIKKVKCFKGIPRSYEYSDDAIYVFSLKNKNSFEIHLDGCTAVSFGKHTRFYCSSGTKLYLFDGFAFAAENTKIYSFGKSEVEVADPTVKIYAHDFSTIIKKCNNHNIIAVDKTVIIRNDLDDIF